MMTEKQSILVCPYCDSLYQSVPLEKNEAAYCFACDSKIKSGRLNLEVAFIYALTALILFIIANSFPFITLSLKGEVTTIVVFSSIQSLFDNHLPILGALVFLFIIVMPLWYLLAVLWVVISFKFDLLRPLTKTFLHWFSHMQPWNMLEVYLIGVIVTMVKILQMASIIFNAGFWAFCALMLCSILVTLRFDLSHALFWAYQYEE